MHRQQTHWLTFQERRIRLVTAGETGPWLVLWPGLGETADTFYQVLTEGPARGYRVAALDAPGHGQSDDWVGEWTATEIAALWQAVLNYLGVSAAFIGGFSYGASAAMIALRAMPARVRGLVLLDGGYFNLTVTDEDLAAIRAFNEKRSAEQTFPSWEAFLTAKRAEEPHWNTHVERLLCADMRERAGQVVRAVSLEGIMQVMSIFVHYRVEDVPALQTPVLLVRATLPAELEERREADVVRLRTRLPHLTVEKVEATHPRFLIEQSEPVLTALWSFLARVSAQG